MFMCQKWLKNDKNGYFWGDFSDFGVKLGNFRVNFDILGSNAIYLLY